VEYFLFDDRGYVKSYDFDINDWYRVAASGSASEQDFLDHGIADLNTIPLDKLHELSSEAQILIYTDDPTKEEITLEITGEYNFLYDLEDPQLLVWTSDVESATKTSETVYIPKPQIVMPVSDIDLSQVEMIESFNLIGNEAGNGTVRVIVSVDGGTTWKSYVESVWQDINEADLEDVKTNGLSITALNGLTSTEIETLRNGSDTIRFAYYLEITNAETDVAETDQMEMVVNVFGDWVEAADGTDYDLTYSKETNTVTVDVLSAGNYKLKY
jgi:hypothetical protein